MIDDDRLLDVIGVAVIAFILLAVVVLVLAGATAPSREGIAPPDTDWTIERADGSHVRIVHAGGEPVDASRLVVSVAGVERSPGRSDRLAEGDAVVVPATPGQTVELYWVSGRDERVRLKRWQAP